MEIKLQRSQMELLEIQKDLARKELIRDDWKDDICRFRREILRMQCIEARVKVDKYN